MPHRTKIRGKGRERRARGGEETVPAPSGHIRRARGSWRGVPRGGAGRGWVLRATPGDPRVTARRARPWRGRKAVRLAGPAVGPQASASASPSWTRGAARPRDPPLLAGQEGDGGPFLSSRCTPPPPRPATLCNPIAAICSPGSRRPARSQALPRPAL